MKKTVSLLVVAISVASNTCAAQSEQDDDKDQIYYTSGVHNEQGCDKPSDCIAERKPGEPTDPLYPKWWISDWTMFRVFRNYKHNMPPYTNPPSTLKASDYQVSYGTTYYDSTYVPEDKDGYGAMMEHYEDYCLPIFPIPNDYTCSFISLGNKAYFLTYPKDRPKDMPPCCLFSPMNHPPRRDFIKHLPYNAKLSTHLNNSVQAYAKWVGPSTGKILFGYAFNKEASPDGYSTKPYRHPQSFFFSGYPRLPACAPIVSQNYTSFRKQQPDPALTWEQVAQMCPEKPVKCQLFNPRKKKSDSAISEWSVLKN